MESLAGSLAKNISNVAYESLPDATIQRAKERILDIVAAILAGASAWDYTDTLTHTLSSVFPTGDATLFGQKEKQSLPVAAMINASLGHSLELDDGHKNAGVHAGTVVIPVAFALGEAMHVSGKKLLTAITIGYDVAYRFATNMSPLLIQKGFHPSAICGGVGATATAGMLLSLNDSQMANALALCAIQVAGLMEATQSGQASKSVMVGHSALTAVLSAYCAKGGIPGPTLAFEGKAGLLQAMSTDVNARKITEGFGERFLIEDTYVKLYPTCRHTHAAIEGIIAMKNEHGFRNSDIDAITVGTFPIAFTLTGKIHRPTTSQDAQFSLAYCVATALLTGGFGMKDLEVQSLNIPERQELDRKVDVYIDDDISAVFPEKRGALLKIRLTDGRVLQKSVFTLKGSPDMPIGWEDLLVKFRNSSGSRFDDANVKAIAESLAHVESLEDITPLVRLLGSTC